MKVTLTMSTPEINISECAKICYGTKSMQDGGKDITSTLVHGHSHLAALRFAYTTVYIEGISVAAQNQLVRSKHLDFMVQSKRYVKPGKGGFEFIMPKDLEEHLEEYMQDHFDKSLKLYDMLLLNGVAKEDARAVLPANTSTKMNVTGSLQAWWDFFKLRMNSHAQREIREVAEEIFKQLALRYPKVFTMETYNTFKG